VRCAITFGIFLATASASLAREPPSVDVGPPLLLRLEGSFAPDREGATAGGADAVSMKVGDRQRWFSAVTARTVGGDHALSGRAVLNLLAPLQPNLIVVGTDELRRRLEDAPDGTSVVVEGLVNRGSRMFLLREVAVGTPAKP